MRRILLGAAVALAGCNDVGAFQGEWSGVVVTEPGVRAGVGERATARLTIRAVDRVQLDGQLVVSLDSAPGDAAQTLALRPNQHAAADTLGGMQLADGPLRSYLLVAPLAGGDALTVVSLYGEERVDLRLVRSDQLYGIFHLHR